VARLLELGYPGGPAVQKAAQGGNPLTFKLPRAWLEGSWNFSFSGLKTAVLREVRGWEEKRAPIPAADRVSDMAASFQMAVVEVLVVKTVEAAKKFGAKGIVVAGGVSANAELRKAFGMRTLLPVYIPPLFLCTDNAAMIAGAGHFRFLKGQRDGLDFDALPNWPLTEV
jgi:N6-L-threonylcarbamoyladenine synthase